MERKVDEAMVAVADEKGLREMIEGGLSESDGSDDDVDANSKRLSLKGWQSGSCRKQG